MFGGKFADGALRTKAGRVGGTDRVGLWLAPGFLDSLTPGRVPEFEEIEAEVKAQWEANQRAEFKQEAYRVMREKYEVVLPEKSFSETGANRGNGEVGK